MNKFLKQLRHLLLSPNDFFTKDPKTKDLKPIAILYLLLVLIATLFDLLSFFIVTLYVNKVELSNSDLSQVLMGSLINFLVAFLSSFVWAFLLHSYLKLFKAKGGFPVTYRIFVYSSVPSLLLGWVPVVGVLASLYGFYLLFLGTVIMHKLSKRTTTIAYLVLIALLMLYAVLRLLTT